jgi:hypothetical protein
MPALISPMTAQEASPQGCFRAKAFQCARGSAEGATVSASDPRADFR